ncbi:MAG: SDR family oxidoreductase [Flavobacteriales bacterium]
MPASRIALVTGANRGIGLEIARQLASEGLQVIITGRDDEQVKAAAASIGRGAEAMRLDVADAASIARLADGFARRHPRLDVLVNNAGIMGRSPATAIDGEEWDRVMATNFSGPVKITSALLPLLRKSSDARIINISSGMGALDDLAGGGYAPYRLSKWALNGFTIQLASELRGTRIRVFSMCPGWVRTGMGGPRAPRSVGQGADTAVWLATAEEPVSGRFYRDRRAIPW